MYMAFGSSDFESCFVVLCLTRELASRNVGMQHHCAEW
ncbi:hypothetical protein CES85_1725 [Ochrobactrum quorumnocens]|uniref:Uncharacterized protein n=1 Tax=Ochrobactrum quorumnocens TaxID=271865 RepID=A0A248UES0_9HYPH|nr:hypothetical protein CES85_1725 [[Ochrobactrum] quorumnocens]